MAAIDGVPVDAHVDRPLAEVLPQVAPEVEPILRRVLDTGEPLLDQEILIPVPGDPASHRRYLTNRYPVRKRDGEIAGVGVALVDITERKRAEEEVRSVTQHARCILFYADVEERDGGYRWQTRVSDDNAAQQVLPLLVEPGETYQDAWVAARHPEDDRQMAENAAAAMRSGRNSYRQEYRVRDRFGSERWLFEDVYLEERGPGRWCAIGVCTDITERKHLEERLKEADRRKDEFLAMLAHELRNPLAAICNASYVLERAQPGRADYQRLLAIVGRQSHHLSRLVDDLLDVSRITHGKIELRKEPCELRAVIQRAADAARNQMERRSHALHLELPARGLTVEADPARLEQVIVNLLGNAAKYTEDGGQVWLSVATEPEGGRAEWARIRIRDTGVGIAPHLLPQVFEMFTQADRSLDRAQGGLGIGLTLVRNLVELHGGTVSAHSDGIGCGSEFTVRLPVLQAEGGRAKDEGELIAPGPCGRRVLVVEDNADAAETLVDILQLWGHNVRVAPTGEEALSLLPQFRPEVVLLDIGLPGMDGYEVARQVRGEGAEPLLVALTGYGQDEDRRRSGEAGFDRHLTKPVNPEELRRVLLADEE
jgi:signal transduction histidine kinase